MKNLWLPCPTQQSMTPQWWSIFRVFASHMRQW
jgi:hypothetical protein